LSFLFKRYMGLSPSKFRSVAGRGIGPTLPEGPRGEREPVGAEATACHATAPGK
jgi:hypothetical protein